MKNNAFMPKAAHLAAFAVSVAFSLYAGRNKSYWSVAPVMLVSILIVLLGRED